MCFYSKTNQMHKISNFLFFLNKSLHVSDGLSVVQVQRRIARKQSMNLYDIYLMLYVQS